jgi:hypothetical protein
MTIIVAYIYTIQTRHDGLSVVHQQPSSHNNEGKVPHIFKGYHLIHFVLIITQLISILVTLTSVVTSSYVKPHRPSTNIESSSVSDLILEFCIYFKR